MAITLWKAVTLSWLTGPIFGKELRISSRRKRNYVLRSVYLAILLLVLVLIWAEEIRWRSSNVVYQASRMYQAGLIITSTVVMIQFFASQIFSVVMLSNSISDEIYHKTLGVLMSTPITSLQIVTGKLLSKLLQILLMLGLTLPILGVVRVFGGVPWDFLLASFCLTLTAVLFAGMLSLNLSIHSKHAYVVIIMALLLLLLLFVLLPLFAAWVLNEGFGLRGNNIISLICLANPWLMIYVELVELNVPGGAGIPITFGWGWTCLGTLAVSAALFLRAVSVVRKKALLQACGQLSGARKRTNVSEGNTAAATIRHIKGPPLLWKEIRQPMFAMGPIKKTLLYLLVGGCLLFSYGIFANERALDEDFVHFLYGFIFVILGVFFTTVFSATTITSERSSQNWPMLLGTLISNWQIVIAKTAGVIRRSGPVWLLLIGHILFFSLVGCIHPAALFHILLVIIPMILFVSASGILFSALLKHTTSAVIMNLIFVVTVWAGIPFLAGILSIFSQSKELIELVMTFNPFYHFGMILEGTAGTHNAHDALSNLEYYWAIDGETGFHVTTLGLFVVGSGYLVLSWLMCAIAANSFRRKVFR